MNLSSSFNFWLTVAVLMATQSSDLDDQKSGATHPDGGSQPHMHQMAEKALRRWRCLVVSHCMLTIPVSSEGSKCLTDLRLSTVWKFKLPQPKMEELHHHPCMPGRHPWWKTCFEMANLASQKQL